MVRKKDVQLSRSRRKPLKRLVELTRGKGTTSSQKERVRTAFVRAGRKGRQVGGLLDATQ